MKLIIKDIKGSTFELDNISEDIRIDSISNQVCEKYNYTNGVRLIYCGRILEQDKLVGDYIKNNFSGFIVCIPNKPVINNQQAPTQETQQPTQVPQQIPEVNNNQRTYTIDEIRAVLLIYTQFIRTTPDIFHIFCTNGYSFQEFIMSPIFTNTLLMPFLTASQDILHAVNSHTSVEVTIPTSNGETIISNSLINTRNTASINTAPINTVIQRPPPEIIPSAPPSASSSRPVSPTVNNSHRSIQTPLINQLPSLTPNNFQQILQIQTQETTLTEEDKSNIDELVCLGFPEDLAKRVYILTNKNKSMAASLLFDYQ
jgi:hypothetical protein